MDELDADRHFDYDTLNRLLILDSRRTLRVQERRSRAACQGLTDTQDWSAGSEVTTSYQYDP